VVDAPSVLDLDRNPLVAHGQHEIHLPLRAALGKVGHAEAEHRTEEVPHHALGDPAGQIRQVGRLGQPLRCEGDNLLQPGGAQGMVAEAELEEPAPPLQAQLQRLDQSQEEGPVQELQIVEHPLQAHLGPQGAADLGDAEVEARRLAGVAAGEAEDLFQQMTVPPLPARAHPQVVLDGAADHRFVEEIGQRFPRFVRTDVGDRVGAARREGRKGAVPCLSQLLPMAAQRLPGLLRLERRQAVVRQERGELPMSPDLGDLPQQQRPHLDRRDAAREAVAAGLDPQGRAAGDQHPDRVQVHQMLELRGPVREVLNLVEQDEGGAPGSRRFMERLPQYRLRIPAAELQDRTALEPPDLGDLVELDTEDPFRVDALGEELVDDLGEEGGLPDLPWTPQHDCRGEPVPETPKDRPEGPAPEGGNPRGADPLPPRVVVP